MQRRPQQRRRPLRYLSVCCLARRALLAADTRLRLCAPETHMHSRNRAGVPSVRPDRAAGSCFRGACHHPNPDTGLERGRGGQVCFRRNVHGRQLGELRAAAEAWEPAPPAFPLLDVAGLLRGEARPLVTGPPCRPDAQPCMPQHMLRLQQRACMRAREAAAVPAAEAAAPAPRRRHPARPSRRCAWTVHARCRRGAPGGCGALTLNLNMWRRCCRASWRWRWTRARRTRRRPTRRRPTTRRRSRRAGRAPVLLEYVEVVVWGSLGRGAVAVVFVHGPPGQASLVIGRRWLGSWYCAAVQLARGPVSQGCPPAGCY